MFAEPLLKLAGNDEQRKIYRFIDEIAVLCVGVVFMQRIC